MNPLRPLIVLFALTLIAGCASRVEPPPVVSAAPPPILSPEPPTPTPASPACTAPSAYAPAAQANAERIERLAFSPWGAAETGWLTYAPLIGAEIGSDCPPRTPGFAADLARWQEAQGLTPHGVMEPQTYQRLRETWQARRPFVAIRAQGLCPDPPPPEALPFVAPGEGYMGKAVQLEAGALAAFRRMRAAAREALGPLEGEALTVFSGFRAPAADDARCAVEGNCDGIVRAACSGHRTGRSLDLTVGAAPGYTVDSSAAPNRLYQTTTPAYRWLVANAARFGFVPYVFEPWHWEWTGAATP